MTTPVPVPAWLLFAVPLAVFLLGIAVAQLNFWLIVHRPVQHDQARRPAPPAGTYPAPHGLAHGVPVSHRQPEPATVLLPTIPPGAHTRGPQ